MGADDVLVVQVDDRVATVTLNRPGARNALSAELLAALPDTMAALDEDSEVDVLVLTGADPAFCAGLDLKDLAAGRIDLGRLERPFGPLAKPVIGAVNGVAVTGGLEVALTCDFIVASDRARFADTHARIGVQPGWGLTALLPQAIGLRRSREMSLTGNTIDAPTALAWGLVNRVVPHEELLATCRALAADIVSNEQEGARRLLRTYAEGAGFDAATARRLEWEAAAEWRREGRATPEEVERRRGAVIARGRQQLDRP